MGKNNVRAIQTNDGTFTNQFRIYLADKNISFIASDIDVCTACDIADVEGYSFKDRTEKPGAINKYFSFETGIITTIS